MLPFFPEKVNNVTVKVGQNALLKCKVEKLNSYKVGFGGDNNNDTPEKGNSYKKYIQH